MEEVCIFIDESGAHGFDFGKDGVTEFYVLVVIIIDQKYKDEFLTSLQNIYQELTPSPKPKAKIFNKDENKRNKLINKVSNLKFKYFNLIVDKKEIDLNSGLVWKNSFYKYFQAMCYNRFINSYRHITVNADEYGSKEFQDSFVLYIKSKFKPDLFQTLNINSINSSGEDLEKYGCFLSDNLSGIIRYNLEKKIVIKPIFQNLKSHLLGNIEFPFNKKNIDKIIINNSEDTIIKKISLGRALEYLETNNRSNGIINREASVLEYLFLESLSNNTNYLFSYEIGLFLKDNYDISLNNNELKQTIIKKLRDDNLLISSSNKGYKITTSKQDVKDYLDLTDKNTVNSIKRLNKFLIILKSRDVNLNFMNNSNYDYINKFLEVVSL